MFLIYSLSKTIPFNRFMYEKDIFNFLDLLFKLFLMVLCSAPEQWAVPWKCFLGGLVRNNTLVIIKNMKPEGLCSFQYGHPSQMQIFGK